jgi:hypothetical protein
MPNRFLVIVALRKVLRGPERSGRNIPELLRRISATTPATVRLPPGSVVHILLSVTFPFSAEAP